MLTSRAVRRADAAVVAGLWTAANTQRQAEVGLQLGPVDGADIAEAERQVRRRLTDPASFALLVEEDSDPVALALVLQALAQDGALGTAAED